MKRALLLSYLILLSYCSNAQLDTYPKVYGDIVYSEMSYQFLDSAGGFNNYRVILKLGEACTDNEVYNPTGFYLISGSSIFNTVPWVFDSVSAQFFYNDPCIITRDAPCYRESDYHADISLKSDSRPYEVSTWMCCRVDSNLYYDPGPTKINGIVYQTFIPGDTIDNSPVFNHDSLYFFHKGRPFQINYGATDADGDSLSYEFCSPYNYNINIIGILGLPNADTFELSTSLPNPPVRFANPFSASQPLGAGVTINSLTGLISGSVDQAGRYLVTVCATEYRQGIPIGMHSKEFEVNIYDSSQLIPVLASIPPYDQCDSFTVQFTDSSSPRLSYAWEFGDGTTSTLYSPVHTYADTGNYLIRLIVNPGLYCADTAYSNALIYPGLVNSYTYADTCINQQVQFTGSASTVYGSLDYYHWDFGDPINNADTLDTRDAAYQYARGDTNYRVSFTAGTDKGCQSIQSKLITVYQNPLIYLARDTIISLGQTFQIQPLAYNTYLSLTSQYTYQWSPPQGLDDPFIRDPTVTSDQDISYDLSTRNLESCTTIDTFDIKYVKGPDIYVPNAFTPNGDGKNDIFRPLPVGIKQIDFFRVYDRWGKLVYQTMAYLQGWDGNIHGSPAQTGAYVWEVQGTDYSGNIHFKKGTVILIR